ncbi:putative mitochondrial import inner membrane translocase subunit TIM10 [Venustampulla echinocandica]|uniref:Mitochondrial import inner membrane translocase subunit n=1 Tax=Venustampulla echinocandica TaxID=2656787 RepID=A0A370TES1_9HELO|nr:putative mitochondrial import inner membrane translocase subunit TIM10 [Venustampulla echinocandica]RDL33140.1 putative mitochondrial import inner membrane translocase subunit TIM10 [Venustampulla echinocandica]
MSMFGFGKPQPSSAEKIAAAEQEMDLFTDMFNKLQQACMKKCVPKEYREGELNKGEGVCIDRCSSKFFDVQLKISELLQAEAAAKGATGGGFGIGGM